jgi:uncharacterized protein YfaA (DUF2138 family)
VPGAPLGIGPVVVVADPVGAAVCVAVGVCVAVAGALLEEVGEGATVAEVGAAVVAGAELL